MKFLIRLGLIVAVCLLLAGTASAQNASFWFARGEQEAQAGKWSKAIPDYREALRHNPRYVDAYIGLARAYNSKNRYKEAITVGMEATHLSPNNMLAYYNLGVAYYQLKRWKEAQKAFDKAVTLQPDTLEANIGAGLMHLHYNRIPEAIKSFNAALAITPDSPVGHFGLGMAFIVGRNRKDAEDQYNVLLLLSPSMAAQLQRAISGLPQSDTGEAASNGTGSGNNADAAAQSKTAGRWQIGLIYVAGGLPIALAAGWFLYSRNRGNVEPPMSERIEIKDPNSLVANPIVPVAAAPTSRPIRQPQEILPPSTLPVGNFTAAPPRKHPETTTLLDTPSHIATSQSQFRAGNTHYKAGNYQEAMEAYKDAVRLNPNNMEAFNSLGQCHARLEAWDEAADAYKQAIRVNPDNAAVHCNLGEAYLALEQPQEALEACKQAIRLNPNDPKAHYQYGLTSIALNDKATALDEFKILKKTSPELANKLFNAIYPS